MTFRKYSHIEHELVNLSRQDQYEQLLNTIEWHDFRQKVIDRDFNKCTECGRSSGPIYEFRCSTEEYTIECEEVRRKNSLRKKFIKENEKLYIEFLITGNHSELIPEDGIFRPRERQVGEVILHVHHSLYFFDKLPWQYSLKYMKTLCSECHAKFHQNNKVYMYKDESMEFRRVTLFCWKCNGSGVLPEFYYVQKGVCFECNGLGFSVENSHGWEKVIQ